MSPVSAPDSLDELLLRTGDDIRPPLLRSLVDLYLQKPTHTAEEARHFSELTLRLLDQADLDTRIAMARRLASYPSAPTAIMQRLAIDLPELSALVRLTASGGDVAPAQHSPSQALVSPDKLSELSELFFAASAAERRLILINLVYTSGAAAAVQIETGGEAARQLETAALDRNIDAFARAIERWLGIGPALAHRIVSDPLGEPIVVAARLLGIASDALQRILLFINPAVGRSVSRVYELAALFDAIDVRSAHVLVGIWRATDPPRVARAGSIDPAHRGLRRSASARITAPQQRGPAGAQADGQCVASPRGRYSAAAK